jgi:hypothetical protein
MFPQIKLSTILICMVVAFLLFTVAGHEVVGAIFLIVAIPIVSAFGIDISNPYIIYSVIVCGILHIFTADKSQFGGVAGALGNAFIETETVGSTIAAP